MENNEVITNTIHYFYVVYQNQNLSQNLIICELLQLNWSWTFYLSSSTVEVHTRSVVNLLLASFSLFPWGQNISAKPGSKFKLLQLWPWFPTDLFDVQPVRLTAACVVQPAAGKQGEAESDEKISHTAFQSSCNIKAYCWYYSLWNVMCGGRPAVRMSCQIGE